MGFIKATIGWFSGNDNNQSASGRAEPHLRAAEYQKALLDARAVYAADRSNDPIDREDYKVLLGAFRALVALVRVSDAYDTDFRRNLPAGGWRGLQAPDTMAERIQDVYEYLVENNVYALAGKSLIDNLLACLDLSAAQVDLDHAFVPAMPTLIKIQSGNIR